MSDFQPPDPFPCGLVRTRTRPLSVADRGRDRCRRTVALSLFLLSFLFFSFFLSFFFFFSLFFFSLFLFPLSPSLLCRAPRAPERRSGRHCPCPHAAVRAPGRPHGPAAHAHAPARPPRRSPLPAPHALLPAPRTCVPPLSPSVLAAQAAVVRTRSPLRSAPHAAAHSTRHHRRPYARAAPLPCPRACTWATRRTAQHHRLGARAHGEHSSRPPSTCSTMASTLTPPLHAASRHEQPAERH